MVIFFLNAHTPVWKLEFLLILLKNLSIFEQYIYVIWIVSIDWSKNTMWELWVSILLFPFYKTGDLMRTIAWETGSQRILRSCWGRWEGQHTGDLGDICLVCLGIRLLLDTRNRYLINCFSAFILVNGFRAFLRMERCNNPCSLKIFPKHIHQNANSASFLRAQSASFLISTLNFQGILKASASRANDVTLTELDG